MTEDNIRDKVRELDFRLPAGVRKRAFDTLLKTEDRYLELLFDEKAKFTWEGFAGLADKIGFPRNIVLLPKLIQLLKDLNWPGALPAAEVLCKTDKKELVPLVEFYVKQAYYTKDYMWLGGLKELIGRAEINSEDFYDPEAWYMLEYADF